MNQDEQPLVPDAQETVEQETSAQVEMKPEDEQEEPVEPTETTETVQDETPAPDAEEGTADQAEAQGGEAARGLPIPLTRHDIHQALSMLKAANLASVAPFSLRPAILETLRQHLAQQQAQGIDPARLLGLSENKEGESVSGVDLAQLTGQHLGPRLTLGQLAEQMRAKSRAEARAKGEGDVRADDKYEEYAYSVCAPGTERTGRWTKDEHERFVEGLKRHGKQWKKVAAYVGTRTVTQTKTHAQKYFQKIQKASGPAGEKRASKRKRNAEDGEGKRRKKSEDGDSDGSNEGEEGDEEEEEDDEEDILTEAELAAAQVLATQLV